MTHANKSEVNAAEPAAAAKPWLGSAWFPHALSGDGDVMCQHDWLCHSWQSVVPS